MSYESIDEFRDRLRSVAKGRGSEICNRILAEHANFFEVMEHQTTVGNADLSFDITNLVTKTGNYGYMCGLNSGIRIHEYTISQLEDKVNDLTIRLENMRKQNINKQNKMVSNKTILPIYIVIVLFALLMFWLLSLCS